MRACVRARAALTTPPSSCQRVSRDSGQASQPSGGGGGHRTRSRLAGLIMTVLAVPRPRRRTSHRPLASSNESAWPRQPFSSGLAFNPWSCTCWSRREEEASAATPLAPGNVAVTAAAAVLLWLAASPRLIGLRLSVVGGGASPNIKCRKPGGEKKITPTLTFDHELRSARHRLITRASTRQSFALRRRSARPPTAMCDCTLGLAESSTSTVATTRPWEASAAASSSRKRASSEQRSTPPQCSDRAKLAACWAAVLTLRLRLGAHICSLSVRRMWTASHPSASPTSAPVAEDPPTTRRTPLRAIRPSS